MNPSAYFDSNYDVIIIGAALAGLSASLELAKAGKKVLVLEQHNLPGGVATSYCRGGVEFEAALHEMMSIGEKDHPLSTRKFLEGHGIYVDWVRIPEAFHYVDDQIDVLIHSGKNGDIDTPSRDIAAACGDENKGPVYQKIHDFLLLCQKVQVSCEDVQNHKRSVPYIALHHPELARTAGYSSLEVMKAYDLPKRAIDLLSAYWVYLGSPASDLPFSVYAYVLAQYLGNGSYIPRHTSHEMSIKMAEKAREYGAQIEFGQCVDKILIKDGVVAGVRTASGVDIHAPVVLCGAYPNTVYTKMLEPDVKVPREFLKATHAKKMGVSAFSVVMLLDKTPEELGIKDYATFLYVDEGRDDAAYENGKTEGPFTYLACICPSVILDDAAPEGHCIYSITYTPNPESYFGANEENYVEINRKNAAFFIEKVSKMLGTNLGDHIEQITLETPITIAHYTGAYLGGIYGYSHSMSTHIVARMMYPKGDQTFPGLRFIGAHQMNGDGMTPVINSGIHAARDVLESMKKGGKK